MISLIQHYFQKHFKLVFLLLLAAVGIPMVFIYSASGGLGNQGRARQQMSLFGYDWAPGAERAAIEARSQLSAELGNNTLTATPEGRAAYLHYADEFGVPLPTTEQLAAFIKTRPVFQGADGQYDPQAYARIRDMLASNIIGYSEAQVRQVLVEDWRLEQVEKAIAGPGYVAEADIKRAFNEAESLWSVTTATLDLSSIQATAEPTDDELRIWFESNMSRYETPSQVIVDYVEFTPETFAASIPAPTDADIVAYFERTKASYQKPPTQNADGTTTPAAEVQLADVRDQVILDLNRSRAIRRAHDAASNLTAELTRNPVAIDSPEFERVLAANQVALKRAPAFGPNEWPTTLNWTPAIANTAWQLSPTNPVSDARRAGDNTVVLFFRNRTAPIPATFESARSRLVADVKADKRRQAIVARGQELQRQLAASVAGGQTFAAAAEAAGLQTHTWEKFKVSGRPPEQMPPAIFQNLEQQKVGEVSQMATQGETGTFVFVSSRVEPDPTVVSEAYASARSGAMDYAARLAANIALREVVEKAKLAGGVTRPEDAP